MPLPNKDARDFVFEFLERSDTTLRKFVEPWEEAYRNYLVKPRNIASMIQQQHFHPYLAGLGYNQAPIILKDPETHASNTVMSAHIFARTVGDAEFIRVTGASRDDPRVGTWTNTVKSFWRRRTHTHNYWKAILDSTNFGVGWLKNTVDIVIRYPYRKVRIADTSGATIEDYQPQAEVSLEPALRYVNPFNFHPDWSSTFGKEMVGGVEDGKMSAKMFEDHIKRIGGRYVNKAALRRALDNNKPTFHFNTGQRGVAWRQLAVNQLTEDELKLPDKFRPVQFWEYRGIVPWKGIDDPERHRVIIICNNEVVLDAPQPYYPHPYRPINMLPIGGRALSVSPGEVGLIEQDVLDTIRTLIVQAAIRSTRQPIIADGSAFDDAKELEDAPSGQVILTEGSPVGSTDTIKFDFSGIFNASQQVAIGKEILRAAIGLPGLLSGIPAGGRTTKAEIDQLTVSANLPMDIRVRLIEDEDLPAIGEDLGARFIYALRDEDSPNEELRKRIGSRDATLEHLEWEPGLHFIGSQQFRSGESRANRLERLANFLLAVPGAASIANIPQMIVDILAQETPDAAERYLNDAMTALGQSLTMEQLAGGGAQRGMPSQPRPPAASGANNGGNAQGFGGGAPV